MTDPCWLFDSLRATVRCSALPPQSTFIRKATVCLRSFTPICAESEAVCMVIYMKHWKRICCGILVLLLLVSCLPASVFALDTEAEFNVVFHYQLNKDGTYSGEFDYTDEFYPMHWGNLDIDGNEVNLWVYTGSMTKIEQTPGNVVPYLIDELGQKWELSSILLANDDLSETGNMVNSSSPETYALMDENAIRNASRAEDYIISTETIDMTPGRLGEQSYTAYAIIYGWKLVDEGETPVQYTVSYKANLPTGVNKLFPVVYTRDTGDKMLDIDEGIGVNQEWVKEIEGEPTQVYASQPYTVSDYKNNPDVRNYCDFLVFDTRTKTYYDFGGWRAGDNVYEIGDKIEDLSTLADENGNIEFSGVWNEIEPLENSELYELYPKLNLDVFHRDNDQTDEDVLLTQQTNTDENLSTWGKYTSQPVTLDENGVISYRLAGKVSSSLTSTTTTSGGSYITYSQDFCSYTITLNVDGKLEFAYPKADGTVSLSFTCPYLEPEELNVDGATIELYAKWEADRAWTGSGDVSHWLDTVNHKAFLSGYPDGTFGTDRNMTRAEVAQMFYSLLLDKDVKITKTFTDVPTDAWYAKAVNTLASLGMLGGYPDGTFQPERTITRAEFAVVALAFTDGGSGASCSFTDVNRSDWFYPYAAQASAYGWIGGYPDGSFRPNNKITRAEVSVIVNNMLGRDADERFIDRNQDKLVSFTDLTSSHWAYYAIMEAANTHTYTRDGSTEVWKAAT